MRACFRLLSAVVAFLLSGAASACETPGFPAVQLPFHVAQPELAWHAVPGATAYLVELVARVPEGPVVERRTHRTAQSFTHPAKLDAARTTKISLSVTALCGDRTSAAASRSMIVIRAGDCASVTGLAVRDKGSQRSISWTALPGLDYEVRGFDAHTGASLFSSQANTAPGMAVPGSGPLVVSVRANCGRVIGGASYLFVP